MKLRFILCGLLIFSLAFTGEHDYLNDADCIVLENENYDEFDLTNFDIVMPKSETPTPLVIYIHGGGFTHGDKSAGLKRKDDVLHFLESNIAFATINYRFYNRDDSVGVKLCLNDVKTALQYIRFHADEYNIDKNLVGCYGTSAGAGSSLYLAFHDEMAIENDTTLLGESTRILCAGALETQATYDIMRWKQYIPALKLMMLIKGKTFKKSIANFYGYAAFKDFKPEKKGVLQSLDMLDMIDSEDAPVYVMNMQKERFPKDNNTIQHHRKHAVVLAKKLKKNDVEHYLYIKSRQHETKQDVDYKVSTFMVDHLLK